MAVNYTYEQFLKAAQDAGLWDSFSDADRRLAQSNPNAGMSLLGYKKDYAGAGNDQARLLANAGAENIRKQYGGYTGGSDGSGYALMGGAGKDYDARADALLKLIQDREPFSYDADKDPSAQAYKKQYAREGQRATQDTMGAAASLTGGIPSSYAASAAAQAGNYYAAQGADKIAELEQIAYGRYRDEGDRLTDQWSMLRSQADSQRSQADAEYQKQYELAMLAAQYGDYSGLEKLGIDTSKMTATGSYGYSGGGNSQKVSDNSGGYETFDTAARNDLLMKYPDGTVPFQLWAALAATYGESALTAAGFKKGAPQSGSSGGAGGGNTSPAKNRFSTLN